MNFNAPQNCKTDCYLERNYIIVPNTIDKNVNDYTPDFERIFCNIFIHNYNVFSTELVLIYNKRTLIFFIRSKMASPHNYLMAGSNALLYIYQYFCI